MSPENNAVLLEEIARRLKGVVPYIKTVGCEDSEELYADAVAMEDWMGGGSVQNHTCDSVTSARITTKGMPLR